jgi:serine/threonine protein kinase
VDDTVSTAPSATTAPIGVCLSGRYRLGALIGSGGMAEVHEAEDTLLQRPVAIKLFRPGSSVGDGDIRQRAEIRLLAGLNHPALVTLFDAGTDDDCPLPRSYLVMELVPGTSLREVLRAGAMPAIEVAAMGCQLAGALTYIHARGVVHRDIKPANILIGSGDHSRSSEVSAKLTDFGVARMLDDTRITELGMTVGTANYLSPEQATASDVGPASDIYSLGLTLLECLTGQVAFPGHGVESAIARLHRGPVLPVSLGPGWTRLLARMTAASPAERPPAHEVAAALGELSSPSPDSSAVNTVLAAATTDSLGPLAGIAWDTDPSLPSREHRPGGQGTLGRHGHPRRFGWRFIVLVAGVVLFLAAVLLVVLAVAHQAPPAGVAPTYAPVPGQLGVDLHRLQEGVAP